MSSDAEPDDDQAKETFEMSCCEECPHCTMSFSSGLDLQRHIEEIHGAVNGDEVITLIDPNEDSLQSLNMPIGLPTLSCHKIFINHGHKSFNNKSLLRKHITKSHNNSGDVKSDLNERYNTIFLNTCLLCSKSFKSSPYLRKHMMSIHAIDNSQNIDTIDLKADVDVTDETVDENIEDLEQALSCDNSLAESCATCFKTFKSKITLQKHVEKFHSISLGDDAPRPTSISENSDDVGMHIEQTHKDANRDKANLSLLKANLRSRESLVVLKKNSCKKCAKTFISISALQNHLRKFHPRKKRTRTVIAQPLLVICTLCSKLFRSIARLREHVVAMHKDCGSETANAVKKTKRPFVYSCKICSRTFLRKDSFQKHVNYKHRNDVNDASEKSSSRKESQPCGEKKASVERLFCTICLKGFRLKCDLRKHIECFHADVDVATLCPVKKVQSTITCPVCFIKLSDIDGPWIASKRVRMNDLMTHLNEAHNEDVSSDLLTFDNETTFSQWLTSVQLGTPFTFQKQFSGGSKNYVHYYCSKSCVRYNDRRRVGERKCRLKVQGISKVGYTCPAHLVAHRTSEDERVEVKYVAKHYCQAYAPEQLGHIRLNQSDRDWLSAKLSTEVSLDAVLRDILNVADGTRKRIHVLTKNDLMNIERSLRLNRIRVTDGNDLLNVISSYAGGENSPIILYKRQGTRLLDICPDGKDVDVEDWEEDDFLFGMMNSSQCQMLAGCGSGESSVVCVDSTYTTKSKQTFFGMSCKGSRRDFHLCTLMVLDGGRRGFPVAFLYSNRQSEATFTLFLQAVRRRSGVVSCETFMSDMTPQFYNAWIEVMGECPRRRFFSWHVDKSFRDHTRRLIRGNTELPAIIYKQLRSLMIEQDAFTFKRTLHALVRQLLENPLTSAFGEFFELRYANCGEAWALCYRAQLGADTDMHLERMHDIFKHVNEQSKKHQRLEGAIASLLHLVFDKDFNNVVGMRKGNDKKLSEIRVRHEESVGMIHAITSEVTAGRKWFVIADKEMFTVQRAKEVRCACDLQCTECHACVDTYVCSCADSAKYVNMCKHIHLIATDFPLFNDSAGLLEIGCESIVE